MAADDEAGDEAWEEEWPLGDLPLPGISQKQDFGAFNNV